MEADYSLANFSKEDLERLEINYKLAIQGLKAMIEIEMIYAYCKPENTDFNTFLEDHIFQVDYCNVIIKNLEAVEKELKKLNK